MSSRNANINWFAVIITAIVAVFLIVIALIVGLLNSRGQVAMTAPEGDIVNAETGAISFGTGAKVVETYVDFLCPECAAFEKEHGAALSEAAERNEVTWRVHPVAVLDHQADKYSSRAASATYCVAVEEPGKTRSYLRALMENQPVPGGDGTTTEHLATVARGVGAAAATDCIEQEKYAAYVRGMTKNVADLNGGNLRTPTVVLDGANLESPRRHPQLLALLQCLDTR